MESASRHQCIRDLTKMAQLSHYEMESYLGDPEEPRILWTSISERRDVGKRERGTEMRAKRLGRSHCESWTEYRSVTKERRLHEFGKPP